MYISFNSSIFLLFTEPPYKTFGVFLPNLLLINEIEFVRSFDFGIKPVPIDQTGS